MPEHQRGRNQLVGQQGLRPIDVAQHAVQQGGALAQPLLDGRPVGVVDDKGQQVQRPGPRRPVGVGVDVVGDAVFANLPGHHVHAPVQVGKAAGAQ
ncbi:hypothetical protein D3C71_1625670 [compost metagenome]